MNTYDINLPSQTFFKFVIMYRNIVKLLFKSYYVYHIIIEIIYTVVLPICIHIGILITIVICCVNKILAGIN